MINLLQRSLRPLLIAVFFIIAIPFVFITTGPVFERSGAQLSYGKIEGATITVEQFRETESSVYAVLMLRYGQIPESPELRHQVEIETWQRLLFMANAKKIGLKIDDAQVIDFIQHIPALQDKGVYQPGRYDNMVAYFQKSLGISPTRFTEVIREELTVEKMQSLLVSSIRVPATDVTQEFNRIYGAATVSTINFSAASYRGQVSATPEEIQNEFKTESVTNPDFRTKERRSVSYVVFPVGVSDQKLPDAQKEEARRKLSEKALEFALALEPEPDATNTVKRPEFADLAKSHHLTVAKTSLFAADEAPAPLAPSPNFNRAAFGLTKDHPTSSVIDTPNGFYILKLEDISPSQPRALAEVRAQIEEKIKDRKANVMAQEAGRAAAEKIKAETAKGVAFRAAASQLKLAVETLPSFVPGDPKLNDPKLALIRRVAMMLKLGDNSGFVPTATGGVIASLDSRQAPDVTAFSGMQGRLESEMLAQARNTALSEWVRLQSSSTGTVVPAILTQKSE